MQKVSVLPTIRKKKVKVGDLIFYICFIALPVLQFVLFYIGVNFQSILLAFQTFDPETNTTTWVLWDNFKTVFENFATDTYLSGSLVNSLIMFVVKICIGIPLGLLFSFYIYKKYPLHNFFRVMLFLPSVVSAIVMVSIFQNLVDVVIPQLMINATGENFFGLLVNPETKFGTLIFYNIWISFGVTVLMYVDAMKSISPSVVEAGALDGATGMKEFTYITLPSIFETCKTFIIIAVAGFFTDQANMFSFFGRMIDQEIMTVGYYLYSETYWATYRGLYEQYNYLAALGLCMTLIAIPVTLGLKKLLEKIGPSGD